MKNIDQYELTLTHKHFDHLIFSAWSGGMHVGYFKVGAKVDEGKDFAEIEISELVEKVQN